MATEQHPHPEAPRTVATTPSPNRPAEFPRIEHAPSPRSSGGFGMVLLNAAVAILAGGGGAWGYLNYIHPELAAQQTQPAQPAGAPAADPSRLDDLTRRLENLQARVERLPKPSELPDLEPINQKLSQVDDLSRKLEVQRTRLGSLPEKIDEQARKITTVTADLDRVRNELASLRSDLTSRKPAAPASTVADMPAETTAPLRATPGGLEEDPYARGVQQYAERQYKAAGETFQRLTRSRADDARVWYYAALARGFDTGNWKGETEQLVTQGVEREKAGKPEKAKIDAAFAGLTTETGKDWLEFYRRRAAAR